MDQRHEALLIFRGAYGRLCTLSALALDQGYHPQAVTLASRGQGRSRDDTLKELKRARSVVHTALDNARDHGNTQAAIDVAGEQAQVAVESEWDCPLPIVTSAR